MGDRPIFGQLNLHLVLPKTTVTLLPDSVQWPEHTTPEMAKIEFESCLVGLVSTTQHLQETPRLSGGVDQAGCLRVSQAVAYIYA